MKLHEYSGLKVVLCIFSNYEKNIFPVGIFCLIIKLVFKIPIDNNIIRCPMETMS